MSSRAGLGSPRGPGPRWSSSLLSQEEEPRQKWNCECNTDSSSNDRKGPAADLAVTGLKEPNDRERQAKRCKRAEEREDEARYGCRRSAPWAGRARVHHTRGLEVHTHSVLDPRKGRSACEFRLAPHAVEVGPAAGLVCGCLRARLARAGVGRSMSAAAARGPRLRVTSMSPDRGADFRAGCDTGFRSPSRTRGGALRCAGHGDG